MYPATQVQLYPLTISLQVAELLHGDDAHSFISANMYNSELSPNMASKLENELCCVKHFWGVYCVNSVCANDWTTE